MSHRTAKDFFFDLARGVVNGFGHIEKFGCTVNADDGVLTDLWDRANVADDQPIWVAPTQARIHQLASSDAGDTLLGAGARTIRITGLISWDADEITEDIELNGTTNVPTVNAYVIIHRIEVLTNGATSINIGTVTATADVDGTVTAQLTIGKGQTEMAIYGVPSTQIAYIHYPHANLLLNKGKDSDVSVKILVNTTPKEELLHFIQKFFIGLRGAGTSDWQQSQDRFVRQVGPCIIKMQCLSDTNDTICFGGFDVILEKI
jgi:hypothetical protein